MWALVFGGLRAFVVQAEHCGDSSPESLHDTAAAAVGWFERNQHDDGTWLYRYDRDLDAPVASSGGSSYNITRHAGVTMSLEQAATAGFDDATGVSERGIAWALDHLYEGPGGWRALAGDDVIASNGRIGSGATGLLTAGLAIRRERTGDDRYDTAMHDLGAFMVSLVNERGQVHASWDIAAGAPTPGAWSKYYTGEVFWALTLLHRIFPDAGFGEPAERIARYIATERTEIEQFEPDLPDHWAAYGFAVMSTWPDFELPEEYDYYVRRQAGIFGMQIRYESQRTNSFFSYVTRGRQTLGAGLGTVGEALSQWYTVAISDDRFDDLVHPIAERARCTAGAAAARQVGDDDVAADDDRDVVHGAWFQFDVTQMDDQQHALSAVLGALAIPTSTAGESP
jgi:hypothetical protein